MAHLVAAMPVSVILNLMPAFLARRRTRSRFH